MKKIFSFILASLLMLTMTSCSHQPADAPPMGEKKSVELHVAAAASLTNALQELANSYKLEHPEVTITFNFGSSGALQQAIEHGGETDLFFSASPKQMNALERANLLVADTRKDLLENSIVLIVPQDSHADLKSFASLDQPELNHIAIGDPQSVPVGQYTEEILVNIGIMDKVKPKAVYGSDVRQVLTWVAAGEADCGIVYSTDAAITPQVRIAAKAPAESHTPVIYPAAVINTTKQLEEAKAFLAFASSEQAKNIFAKYGFICK